VGLFISDCGTFAEIFLEKFAYLSHAMVTSDIRVPSELGAVVSGNAISSLSVERQHDRHVHVVGFREGHIDAKAQVARRDGVVGHAIEYALMTEGVVQTSVERLLGEEVAEELRAVAARDGQQDIVVHIFLALRPLDQWQRVVGLAFNLHYIAASTPL